MIPNLLLLTGDDDFRLRERARFLREGFRTKYPDGEVEFFEQADEFAALENSVLTPNLFGGKRLAVCDQFWSAEKFETAQKADFFKRLPDFTDTATILCLEPKLDKRTKWTKFFLGHSRTEAFAPLDESGLLRWIERAAETFGGNISRDCAQFLLNRCGENLWLLSREIAKLTAAAGEKPVEKELILELTLPHPQLEIWDFLEQVSRKNATAAIGKFRSLLQMGQSVQQIFSMLQREVRIHAQIRAALDHNLPPAAIAKQTKLHPFVVQKTLPLSRQFSRQKIEQLYDHLFEIERRLKSGGIVVTSNDTGEFELAIEKFIVTLCHE